jgi:hypothetical protein
MESNAEPERLVKVQKTADGRKVEFKKLSQDF